MNFTDGYRLTVRKPAHELLVIYSTLEWHPMSVNKPASTVTINVPKMSERLRERTAELAADPSRIIDRTYPF